MYPIEKYKFYTDNKTKVVAVSTYAGRCVRGVAVCADGDEFDLEKGKQIAAAKCNLKIANKRWHRAEKKYWEASRAAEAADIKKSKMRDYLIDSMNAFEDAQAELNNYLD